MQNYLDKPNVSNISRRRAAVYAGLCLLAMLTFLAAVLFFIAQVDAQINQPARATLKDSVPPYATASAEAGLTGPPARPSRRALVSKVKSRQQWILLGVLLGGTFIVFYALSNKQSLAEANGASKQ